MAIVGALAVCYFLLVPLALYYVFRWLRKRHMVNKVHGPWPTLGSCGNALDFALDAEKFFQQSIGVASMFHTPRMFRIWFAYDPMVVIYGAEEVEKLLSSNKHINKGQEYEFLHDWMGTGLITSNGNFWRQRRKMITPTFHYDILRDFVSVFNDQSKMFIEVLSDISRNRQPVNIHHYLSLVALDILCQSAMGRNMNALQNADSEYVQATLNINEIIHDRQKKPWLWPNWAFKLYGRGKEHDNYVKTIHNFSGKVIGERLAEYSQQTAKNGADENGNLANGHSTHEEEIRPSKQRMAFLDLLLDMAAKGQIGLQGVREEVDTFMFAGHDTTTTAMTWLLFLLGNYPDIQQKVVDEVDSVFGSEHKDLTYDDLKYLPYLEICIKEALRLFPSVPFWGRVLHEDLEISGVNIPAQTRVFVFPYVLHRDAARWPDPEIFRPERFSPENCVGRHPYAYVPFSAGPRNCVGQRFALLEEKLVISYVLRYFHVKSLQRRDQITPQGKIICKPYPDVMLELTPRRPLDFCTDRS